jgi:type VI secretion system protein VasI
LSQESVIRSQDFARCAAIAGDLARWECYDQLAESLGLNGPQTVSIDTGFVGEWNVSVSTNPIDDTTNVQLLLQADSARSILGEPVRIVIRCRSGDTNLFIQWHAYLGDRANVLSRVGSEQAQTQTWSISTDLQSTFYPGPESAVIDFVKELIEVDRFVAQVTPYNENPVTAIFDLTGLRNAISPLRETCDW